MPYDRCEVVRLTEKEDMTTESGYQYAYDKLMEHSSRHVTLWASIPCTGGSPWQYVNEAMYYRNGDKAALRRLKGHRTLLRKLFWAFRRRACEVLKLGGTVFEWPTPCQYWRDPDVKNFMCENNMMKASLHGCAYGLKTAKANT